MTDGFRGIPNLESVLLGGATAGPLPFTYALEDPTVWSSLEYSLAYTGEANPAGANGLGDLLEFQWAWYDSPLAANPMWVDTVEIPSSVGGQFLRAYVRMPILGNRVVMTTNTGSGGATRPHTLNFMCWGSRRATDRFTVWQSLTSGGAGSGSDLIVGTGGSTAQMASGQTDVYFCGLASGAAQFSGSAAFTTSSTATLGYLRFRFGYGSTARGAPDLYVRQDVATNGQAFPVDQVLYLPRRPLVMQVTDLGAATGANHPHSYGFTVVRDEP
jgi:hypothetical protein